MRYAHISAHRLIAPLFIFNLSIADKVIESSPTFGKQWFDFRLLFISPKHCLLPFNGWSINIFAWQPRTSRHRALSKRALTFQNPNLWWGKSDNDVERVQQRTQYTNLLLKNFRNCMNLNLIKIFRVEFEESTEFSFSNNILYFFFRSFVRQLQISCLVKLNFYHFPRAASSTIVKNDWIHLIQRKGKKATQNAELDGSNKYMKGQITWIKFVTSQKRGTTFQSSVVGYKLLENKLTTEFCQNAHTHKPLLLSIFLSIPSFFSHFQYIHFAS